MPETLPRPLFERIVPLVRASGMRGHLALVYEVLEGRQSGQIFVDSIAGPRAAVLCSASGFFFAFGAPDQSLLDQVVARFWRVGPDANYTTLFGSSLDWDSAFRRAFAPYHSKRESRLAFELKSIPEMPAIPEGFSLQPITAALAQSILDGTGTANFGIDPWFVRIAGGPQTYAAHGLGLALVRDGCIASICGICGLGGGEVEMEVGTIPAFRGRGLAAIISAAFMHQCQSRGLLPAYSCGSDNSASIAVAHKLGYIEFEEIHGYRLSDQG